MRCGGTAGYTLPASFAATPRSTSFPRVVPWGLHAPYMHSLSPAEGVYAVAWCPTQPDLVATGGADDRAFIWRVGQDAYEQTGGATLELGGHSDTVCALAFNAAGDALASGGMDGRVKVWDAASGRCIQTLEGPGDAVEWVRWHPKGNVVLAGASDFTAWMWLAQTGACMQVGWVRARLSWQGRHRTG